MIISNSNGGRSNSNLPNFFNVARCVVNTKISKLIMFILAAMAIGHLTMHYFISVPPENNKQRDALDIAESNLKNIKHIEELQRIKRSVSSELRDLESQRNKLQDEITGFQSQSTLAEKESKRAQSDLESLKRQILQTKNERLEILYQNPKMAAPVRLLPKEEDNIDIDPPTRSDWCGMHNCFDYSRCSLTSQFPVYVYPPNNNGEDAVWQKTAYILDTSLNAFLGNSYATSDPAIACLYVVIIGEVEQDSLKGNQEPANIQRWLYSLPYWKGDGRNHILVHMSRQSTNQNLLLGVNTGRAMIAQSSFQKTQFRDGFDVILPSLISTSDKMNFVKKFSDISELEDNNPSNAIMQVPVMRKYFLSFVGQWSPKEDQELEIGKEQEDSLNLEPVDEKFHATLTEHLEEMSSDEKHGKILFESSCLDGRLVTSGFKSEWALCGTTESRTQVLSQSTFSLIVAPENYNIISTALLATRLAESLHSGAVPIILGNQLKLPFHEHIDWKKASIMWPKARITELGFLLSSYPHSDILAMRRQGQFIYDTYFSSAKSVLDSMLATVRTRLNIPPLSIQDEQSNVVEHKSYAFEKEEAPGDATSEFAMPPPEGKVDSAKFIRNFTSVTIDADDLWNKSPGPFHLYPSTPFDRILSSDAKFLGSSTGFRPIGEGQGGVGEVFQQSIGGNVPREQFTIVMLTYKREEVMLQSVQRLKGLPYLNKVIVVWNSPDAPTDDMQWPDIGVDVVVIRPKQNSLNNRFLPFSEIDTDAVLSIDDDAHLRHDEILFGFRSWRECRERIVGFPGRYHAWDISENKWKYNADYCCELSMVLTGAAFFHKYYMYMYSYWMPQEIRDKVDELMNCEDIAMNFLVSHLTRLPPIKVTSRWTFRCPGCPEALSTSQSHFDERHICINYFVKVFGYMPLLGTQFRVDSILFKTRLPREKQKCFRFI
ncbi:exostosin-like 3 [Styela clava]